MVSMNHIENINLLFHHDECKRISNQWVGREELFERERGGDPNFKRRMSGRLAAKLLGLRCV